MQNKNQVFAINALPTHLSTTCELDTLLLSSFYNKIWLV